MTSTYQNRPDAVAAAAAPDQHHEAFTRDVQSVARFLHFSCTDASADDRQFLQDVMRGRYGFKALERLLRIGQASRRAEHRDAVTQLAERWSNPTGELPASVYRAFSSEFDAQVQADQAQREFELSPSPTSRERVLEFLSNQVTATRRAIQAVKAAAVR